MEATFTHRDATVDDVDTIYQFGVDNPMRAEVACTMLPYPLREAVQECVESDDRFVMIFDDEDNSLCGAVRFDDTGKIKSVVLRRFTAPDEQVGENEKGNAFGAYLFGLVKEEAGRAISTSPNPATRDITLELGGEFPAEA